MSNKLKKKVSFNLNDNKYHIIYSYAVESETARFGNTYLSDRLHFKRRIYHTQKIIDIILDSNHRVKIYNERFK